jgi:hypothetical protein
MMKVMDLFWSLPWIKPQALMQIGISECAYYMLFNLMHYFQARRDGRDVIIVRGRWYKRKDTKELQVIIYAFIDDEVTKKWKKLF